MSEFSITHRAGCTLVFGSIPLDGLAAIAKLQKNKRKAVMDLHVARLAQATFAVGTSEDLARLAKELEPAARERVNRQYPRLSEEAREWLAVGQQGLSSLAIAERVLGLNGLGRRQGQETAVPQYPSDLARCRKLLEAVPEVAQGFPAMAAVSPAWAALVEAWPRLCAIMDNEAPQWRSEAGKTPETYAAMRQLLD